MPADWKSLCRTKTEIDNPVSTVAFSEAVGRLIRFAFDRP